MALVVFDLASSPIKYLDLPSAESIPKWVDFIREAGKKDIKIFIIGNKCDLDSEILSETRQTA
jgi:GTPase SAR1 family protein